MRAPIPFETIDWADVPVTTHAGVTGTATWRTREVGGSRIRIVEYSPGYFADHWCSRGHIIFVLEGELTTEVEGKGSTTIAAGSSYVVGDGQDPHRSFTEVGAKLLIVD